MESGKGPVARHCNTLTISSTISSTNYNTQSGSRIMYLIYVHAIFRIPVAFRTVIG